MALSTAPKPKVRRPKLVNFDKKTPQTKCLGRFFSIYLQHLPAILHLPALQQLAQSAQQLLPVLDSTTLADTAPATLAVRAPKRAALAKNCFIFDPPFLLILLRFTPV
jgi:hypothetical protein